MLALRSIVRGSTIRRGTTRSQKLLRTTDRCRDRTPCTRLHCQSRSCQRRRPCGPCSQPRTQSLPGMVRSPPERSRLLLHQSCLQGRAKAHSSPHRSSCQLGKACKSSPPPRLGTCRPNTWCTARRRRSRTSQLSTLLARRCQSSRRSPPGIRCTPLQRPGPSHSRTSWLGTAGSQQHLEGSTSLARKRHTLWPPSRSGTCLQYIHGTGLSRWCSQRYLGYKRPLERRHQRKQSREGTGSSPDHRPHPSGCRSIPASMSQEAECCCPRDRSFQARSRCTQSPRARPDTSQPCTARTVALSPQERGCPGYSVWR